MTERTTLDLQDGIAWITMDDGKVNALSTGMLEEIDGRLDESEAAGAVTVLAGREGLFSAGFDLGVFQKGSAEVLAMLRVGAGLIERLLAHPFPVLTACTGHAYPMGAFLMLSADVRFGAAGPYRIGMNETAIGLTVPNFALELARHRLTPPGLALVTTAGMFAPETAAALGYLDQVVPEEVLTEAVMREAERVRALDMPSYAATKARINETVLRAVRAAIASDLGPQTAATA